MVVVVGLALAAMVVTALLIRAGRSDDTDDGSSGAEQPARVPSGQPFRARRLGIAGVRPGNWRVRSVRQGVSLTSRDRAGLVAVAATTSPVSPSDLLSSTLTAVRRSYRRVRLSPRRAVNVGGLPATMADATATNSRGVRLDLLVATAKGRRRSYLLQVFVAREALGGPRLAEAQAIVSSLRLSG